MTKEHGLAGLFDDEGLVKPRSKKEAPRETEAELPPVLDDADRSPLDLLADKIGYGDEPPAPPPPPVREREKPAARVKTKPKPAEPVREPEPVFDEPFAVGSDDGLMVDAPFHDPFGQFEDESPTGRERESESHASAFDAGEATGGILCFLLEGVDGRGRRRTLEALNVAAGNGQVRLRTLPSAPVEMDRVLNDALSDTECAYVAFLSWGTEPADDWAVEVGKAFENAPRAAAVSVKAANADPLSPWARVSFFMDETERQLGIARGFDTVVFRTKALRELGERVGNAVRNGELIPAIQGRGHTVGFATEARVSLLTPAKRQDVMNHVREQARIAARVKAKGRGPLRRYLSAAGIMLGYPFRVMAVRAAAKRSIGGTQFREVASKAAMAVFADRRVRAMTMLNPGKKTR